MALMESTLSMMQIGLGPSNTYTTSAMKSALHFIEELKQKNILHKVNRVQVKLHGTLSTIGRARMTDTAVLLGLSGAQPETVDLDSIPIIIDSIKKTGHLKLGGQQEVKLCPQTDIIYINDKVSGNNGIVFEAFKNNQPEKLHFHEYYSLHGGVVSDGSSYNFPSILKGKVPHYYGNAAELLAQCNKNHTDISTIVMKNESALQKKSIEDIINYIDQTVWKTMKQSLIRGLTTEGLLPGELKLSRRAPSLYRLHKSSKVINSDPMSILDWITIYALALSEENAAGGRIVAMPTSEACGPVPAIIEYYNHFIRKTTPEERARYFLTCSAIGLLYKKNASISGEVVGCQGEIGVASSMAAAGLTELMTRNPLKVLSAAEHAMEHSLGMTCDPAKLYVQVPCIERNAIGALKALLASRMANMRTYPSQISLDAVIKTMYETGIDLNEKYRETGHGPIGEDM
ncbi:hypothetical protein M9Y10_045330 [Tritrichomonas musculus]|uniref:L-serine ammonia-lyase n=1 Tax=Tritrichomonas musculus TaxID=1915356 RepID=A0ABR2JVP0_9EUKA